MASYKFVKNGIVTQKDDVEVSKFSDMCRNWVRKAILDFEVGIYTRKNITKISRLSDEITQLDYRANSGAIHTFLFSSIEWIELVSIIQSGQNEYK